MMSKVLTGIISVSVDVTAGLAVSMAAKEILPKNMGTAAKVLTKIGVGLIGFAVTKKVTDVIFETIDECTQPIKDAQKQIEELKAQRSMMQVAEKKADKVIHVDPQVFEKIKDDAKKQGKMMEEDPEFIDREDLDEIIIPPMTYKRAREAHQFASYIQSQIEKQGYCTISSIKTASSTLCPDESLDLDRYGWFSMKKGDYQVKRIGDDHVELRLPNAVEIKDFPEDE